jgi:type I site-specific restriction-modification system R (restriction) subunit
VIIDEAHSSQSGETATELKGVLGGAELREKAQERPRRKAKRSWKSCSAAWPSAAASRT